MPDEVGSALRTTAGDLEETGHPELLPVAETLSELRLQLSGGVRDPAVVGALLGTLSGQARGVAGSGLGAGVSKELLKLSGLLAAQSRVLVALAS